MSVIGFGATSSYTPSTFTVPSSATPQLLVALTQWGANGTSGLVLPTAGTFDGVNMSLGATTSGYQAGAAIDYHQAWYLFNPPQGVAGSFSFSGPGTVAGGVRFASYYTNAASIFSVAQSVSGTGNGSPTGFSLNNNFGLDVWGIFLGDDDAGGSITLSATGLTQRGVHSPTGDDITYDTNGTFSGLYNITGTTINFHPYLYSGWYIIPYFPPATTTPGSFLSLMV